MRLVVEYGAGDGYTYWCTDTVPVVYESPEAFAVEFEQVMKAEYAKVNCWQDTTFAGHCWNPSDFFQDGKYVAPEIMTVDEWFSKVEV